MVIPHRLDVILLQLKRSRPQPYGQMLIEGRIDCKNLLSRFSRMGSYQGLEIGREMRSPEEIRSNDGTRAHLTRLQVVYRSLSLEQAKQLLLRWLRYQVHQLILLVHYLQILRAEVLELLFAPCYLAC